MTNEILNTSQHAAHHHHHHHHDTESKVIFGFWIFVLSDAILFATLFAAYVVLQNNIFGGINITQVATLPFVLTQTLLLLTSSFTYGMGMVSLRKNCKNKMMPWLLITLVLGLIFVGMEFNQFANLINNGYSWKNSAFLSAYFSLVGLQGLHVATALLWLVILMIQLTKQNVTITMKTRFSCFGLFWDFLNIVWVFIFTIVYLMGAI